MVIEGTCDKEKLKDAIRDLWVEYGRSGFEYVARDDVIRAIDEADDVEVDVEEVNNDNH